MRPPAPPRLLVKSQQRPEWRNYSISGWVSRTDVGPTHQPSIRMPNRRGRLVGSPTSGTGLLCIQGGEENELKLLIQPGDGVSRLLKGIKKAKKSVEIVIFRFDQDEVERALVEAAGKGVFVHALIAFTNRGGEEHLRRLETHLLAKGVSVARTAGDLVRYHGKMMLVDRKELYLLAFNFTHLDMDHSRSFGIITRNLKLVQEAGKIFDAETNRPNYSAGYSKFLVSPET